MSAPIGGSSRIDSAGRVYPLDGKATSPESVTEEDVKDSKKLARILERLLLDTATLRRRFNPTRVDFEDVPVSNTGAATQLAHGLNGRVRWSVVGWQCPTNVAPILREDTTLTDTSTLVLRSYVTGTVTVRVEASG